MINIFKNGSLDDITNLLIQKGCGCKFCIKNNCNKKNITECKKNIKKYLSDDTETEIQPVVGDIIIDTNNKKYVVLNNIYIIDVNACIRKRISSVYIKKLLHFSDNEKRYICIYDKID